LAARCRNPRFGVRKHAMDSILDGLAVQEEAVSIGPTLLVFSDQVR